MAFFNKRTLTSLLLASVWKISTLLKIGFISGSRASFFSLAYCLPPLMGKHGDFLTSFCICCAGALYKLSNVSFSLHYLPSFLTVYHIPTLLGIAYGAVLFTHDARTERILLLKRCLLSASCIACIVLFCVHPVGSHAPIYTLLWVLPVINIFLRHSNFFIHALAIMCAMHALGSVLWLYTHATTSLFWMNLLPISCAERILFAGGAWVIDKAWSHMGSAARLLQSAMIFNARSIASAFKYGFIFSLIILLAVCI